ncbi:hypothetical protein EMIHUDRAFT_196093 [Emiliania huxleyi CCMP1516]|uniref:Uncharacterized protein n=2 Tax=Emiliania huxleyi TaxID=2903 RepID=A0A0D3J3G6_EMIH1|nr:hypothetical protein EMIHUDRAFT_196093 [Emiliania huxleyi CCMP1516]EOD18051.1 hypothetical protein EMIHUDRAFT_196093 [Emiliania huxleyi CCMP1516]|eukprot:XP_005770480.1 hypothetical protein EMIHUDRAFT_196093 [Emiliania huxleyi CCMP1516]
MLSGGAHTGGFTRDGPAPSKEERRLPEPAVWRILRDTAGYWPSLMRILGYSWRTK